MIISLKRNGIDQRVEIEQNDITGFFVYPTSTVIELTGKRKVEVENNYANKKIVYEVKKCINVRNRDKPNVVNTYPPLRELLQ